MASTLDPSLLNKIMNKVINYMLKFGEWAEGFKQNIAGARERCPVESKAPNDCKFGKL